MKMKFDIGLEDKSMKVTVTKAMHTKYYFGREVGDHAVYQLIMRGGDGIDYEASVPVMLQEGVAWEFRKDDTHEVSEAEQETNWNEILAKFPDYDGDKSLGQDQFAAFVNWLKSGTATTLIIAKGVSVDRNGVEHHNAMIVRPLGEKTSEEVSPIRAAARAAKKSMPPPAPKKKSATATLDDAWSAYFTGKYIQTDPHGEKFYDICAGIIGHDSADATPEEWAKCVASFKA